MLLWRDWLVECIWSAYLPAPPQLAQNRLYKQIIWYQYAPGWFDKPDLNKLINICLVVEIFNDVWSEIGWWTAFGAHIYQTYLPPQLAQNRVNKHKICIVYRSKLGNNLAIISLMAIHLVVEIFDDFRSDFGCWTAIGAHMECAFTRRTCLYNSPKTDLISAIFGVNKRLSKEIKCM